jgi:signal peptide peptidase SppA
MINHILARFADFQPALVSADQNSVFESCLTQLSKMEHAEQMLAGDIVMGEDFWNPEDSWAARYRPYLVKDGILTIPVRGVLLNNFGYASSWATGYEYIWQAYKRGMEDSDVRGIAIHSNSPGGEVAGNFELVGKMFAMRGKKPVRAFAHEYAYSAAYSIASVADKIIVSRTGGVGSIGVVTMHIDYSKMLEDTGIKVTFIHFGAHKVDGNPYQPLSKDAEARIQAKIDDLGQIFVATVARNRGMDEKTIRDTEALTYSALEAVNVRLADSVGPLDEAIATYLADLDQADEEGDSEMAATKEELEAARAEGRNEGVAAGKAEGAKDGANAARARIAAITGSEAGKKRPTAALKMATSEKFAGVEADAIVEMLGDLPEEQAAAAPAPKVEDTTGKTDEQKPNASGQAFNEAMNDGKPKVDANGTGTKTDDPDKADDVLAFAESAGIPGFRKRA